MNVIILAAGYATRLHPLTLNKGQALLEVAGKPIIERILDNPPRSWLNNDLCRDNNKFAKDFQDGRRVTPIAIQNIKLKTN